MPVPISVHHQSSNHEYSVLKKHYNFSYKLGWFSIFGKISLQNKNRNPVSWASVKKFIFIFNYLISLWLLWKSFGLDLHHNQELSHKEIYFYFSKLSGGAAENASRPINAQRCQSYHQPKPDPDRAIAKIAGKKRPGGIHYIVEGADLGRALQPIRRQG